MTEHEKIQEIVKIKDQVPLPLDDGRPALIVVDVQRYFARPEYPFAQVIEKVMPGATSGYFERVSSIVLGNILRLLAAFRSRQLPVIYLGGGRCLDDGPAGLDEGLRPTRPGGAGRPRSPSGESSELADR